MEVHDDATALALRDFRLRMHRQILPTAAVGAAAVGLALALLLWRELGAAPLLAWLGALAVALALRVAVLQVGTRRQTPPERLLRHHRAAHLVHGLVWAGAVFAFGWSTSGDPLEALTFALAAVSAGALITGAFDLAAAALFAVPVLLPLLARLLGVGAPPQAGLAPMVLIFVAVMGVAGWRAARAVHGAVRLQLDSEQRAREAEAARAALADQHHRLSQLVRSTRQGYWFIDARGVTLEVNDAMCAMLGERREQIVGTNARRHFTGEDLARIEREVAARPRGQGGSYEVGLTRPDGSRLECHNNATPLFDLQGGYIGSVGLWTDLSTHARAQRELRTYEQVINSMSELVTVLDEEQRYRLVNDAWCRALLRERDRVVGRTVQQALGIPLTPERQRLLDECIATQRTRVLRGPSTAPGLPGRVLETTFQPFRDEPAGIRGVVLVTRDVTAEEEARAALAASAEDLRRTLNATGDAIFASDATGPQQPVRFVNRRMLELFGLPQDKAEGLTPADIMAAARERLVDAEAEERRIADIIAHNRADESRIRFKDGRVLLRRCVPTPGPNGPVRVWSFRDVTREEGALDAVQRSESEQRALLDAFPGFIAATDDDLRYTYVNERLAVLFGIPRTAIIGRPVREVIGEERFARIEPAIRRARAGEPNVAERSFTRGPDQPRIDLQVVHVAGPLQPDGSQTCYMFGIDISERKRAEEAAIAAREEAERANQAKSQFMAHMSHELRTPLNAILGFAQILQTEPTLALGARQQAQLDEIVAGARHLLDLINEILDLGRIEAGHVVVEHVPVALAPLVEECLGLVRALAQGRGLRLLPAPALPGDAAVRADPRRLKQVLLNLLSNAIKYNRPGGEVEVLVERVAAGWRLVVRDGGPGLTEAERARLFQPFERLQAARSGVEGTGIGLALSRRLVEAMDGRIGVDSEVGVGSRFWIELGAAVPVAPASVFDTAGSESAAAGPPRRVLYIEDNPVNVVLMEAMLARLPHVLLESASQPAEGLRMAQRDPPALVLLDIQMPGMDGYEVLARLRAHEATRGVPVIAVSADAMQTSIEAARSAGFDGYLTKPLDLTLLLETVRSALK